MLLGTTIIVLMTCMVSPFRDSAVDSANAAPSSCSYAHILTRINYANAPIFCSSPALSDPCSRQNARVDLRLSSFCVRRCRSHRASLPRPCMHACRSVKERPFRDSFLRPASSRLPLTHAPSVHEKRASAIALHAACASGRGTGGERGSRGEGGSLAQIQADSQPVSLAYACVCLPASASCEEHVSGKQ